MTQRAVNVSKNICSFMWDQKLFEVLLALGEGSFVGLFFFSFVSCFAKEKNILVDLLQLGVHSLLKLISPAGPGEYMQWK